MTKLTYFVIKFSFESLLLDSIVLRWSKIGFLAAENSVLSA